VAAFANASAVCLIVTQLIFAAAFAFILVLAVKYGWVPVIERAIRAIPGEVRIANGVINWSTNEAQRLDGNALLAIAIDPTGKGTLGQTADLQLTFTTNRVVAGGLFGMWTRPVPATRQISINRIDAIAWWGAWLWVLLLGLGITTVIAVLLTWWVVSIFYSAPVWLTGQLARRELTYAGAWKLCGAGLLSGATLLAAGIAGYAVQGIRLPGLILVFLMHLVVGWVWIAWALKRLPLRQVENETASNPFQ
jgi:hypothetical protein